MMVPSHNILIFDGVCNLCNRLVKFTIKRDHYSTISFCQLQSTAGKALLKKFNLAADDIDTVIYITNNKHFERSSAVLHLFKDLGGVWKLFYGFIIFPPFIRDYFYDLIAKNRYRLFGKTETCMVPSADISERFLF